MKKKFIKNPDSKINISILYLLKGIVFAFLISILCFFVLSIILSFTNISETIIKPASYIVVITSIVFGSGYTARKVNSKGWIHGALTGFFYILILSILGHFAGGEILFNKLLLSRIFLGIVPGAIGGILGINTQ